MFPGSISSVRTARFRHHFSDGCFGCCSCYLSAPGEKSMDRAGWSLIWAMWTHCYIWFSANTQLSSFSTGSVRWSRHFHMVMKYSGCHDQSWDLPQFPGAADGHLPTLSFFPSSLLAWNSFHFLVLGLKIETHLVGLVKANLRVCSN